MFVKNFIWVQFLLTNLCVCYYTKIKTVSCSQRKEAQGVIDSLEAKLEQHVKEIEQLKQLQDKESVSIAFSDNHHIKLLRLNNIK